VIYVGCFGGGGDANDGDDGHDCFFLVQFSGNGLLRMTWDLSFDLLLLFPWVESTVELSISLSFPSGFDEH
jgi:hypothetical protein